MVANASVRTRWPLPTVRFEGRAHEVGALVHGVPDAFDQTRGAAAIASRDDELPLKARPAKNGVPARE
jgi:hypothetical protein